MKSVIKKKSFFHRFRDLIRLYRVRDEINELRKLGPDATMFLQTASLGEVYMSCVCTQDLIPAGQEMVFITLHEQKYTTGLMRLFPHITRYFFVSRRASELLQDERYAKPLGIKTLNIYEHPFEGKPRNMLEAFKAMLKVKGEVRFHSGIHIAEDAEKAEAVLAEHGMAGPKTVLITPEVKTLASPLLNDEFWVKLAERLTAGGYHVLFNSSRTFGRFPSIFVSIGATIELARRCRHVIGVRSGLLDVLAGETEASMHVLYPREEEVSEGNFGYLALFDVPPEFNKTEQLWSFFSLKMIRDDGKIEETIIGDQTADELIEKIAGPLV